jgi:DNA-directed RNA polymerase specialized sigma24 family protein
MLGRSTRHGGPEWDADQAVTALYGAHHDALAQIALLLLNDIAAAEEVVEAAFTAMHAAWRRLRDSDRALPYLQRAVVRRARSHRAVRPGAAGGRPDMSSSGASLVSALYVLPPRQREALVLRYLADLPDSQIAFVMGVGTRSASNYVEHGIGCLQAVLESHRTAAAHQLAEDTVTTRTPPISG